MTKAKYLMVALLTIFILFMVPTIVNAVETQTTTSDINGVTVQWSYTLNDSDKIENLKCTNASELTGNITVPSELAEKTVVGVGNEAFKSATNITGVTISSSITSIGYGAFEGCTNLTDVDLGSITDLSFDVFKGCTSLTEITIPKTLKNGSVSPCLNNTNITEIILEDGLTIVPSYLCANTGITEIVIPDSVTEIEHSAFEGCTNLTSVDLGSITDLYFDIFEGCTSLTELTIPKTLKHGSVSPCFNNKNITKITLEDGLTIVPSFLCANTGITEIVIPGSVTEIEYSAFDDCTNLKKITILDNVKEMGFYKSSDSDSVFKNHDEDLTIYCYKDSIPAQYAIKYKIKYVYLSKPSTDNQDKTNNQITDGNTAGGNSSNKGNTTKDNTTAGGTLPQTGIESGIVFVILMLIAGGVFAYYKYKNLKNI